MNIDKQTDRQSPADRIDAQRSTIAALERANKKLQGRLDHAEEFTKAVAGAVEPFPPFKAPRRSRSKTKKPVTACLVLSDWHIGEMVSLAETAGVNEYNWQIAQDRMKHIVESFISWTETYRSAFTLDEVCVFSVGDLVTGTIHQELAETNEFPVPIATAKAGQLLGEVYRRLAEVYPLVRGLQAGAGNHDRLTIKPRAKRKAEDSYTFLVHALAAQAVSQLSNVKIECPNQIAPAFDVAGHRVIATHGNEIKSVMGIPYYGIARYFARHAAKEQAMIRKGILQMATSLYIFGHFHHFNVLQDGLAVMNPSLVGPNEYDETAQRFAEPAQLAFLMSPNHGAFSHVPFRGE